MSTTPRTDAARGFHDMDTAVSAEDMAKIETELTRLRADLERFTGHGLLDCHAICDQRDAAVAELARLLAENEDLAIRAGLRLSALDYEKLNAEALKARTEKAEAELAAEREKVRVLREALEDLRDEQNGAPLCTREIQWKEAMDKADAALDATKEAIK